MAQCPCHNQDMQALHNWQLTTGEAIALQEKLRSQVIGYGNVEHPSLIAGVDICKPDAEGVATSAMVVLDYPQLQIVEVKTCRERVTFPYIPGLLTFREAPLILAAYQQLSVQPDLFFVDGQGVAHPRRMGIAAHLGLWWNRPTIGCAKSRLLGEFTPPGEEPGNYSLLTDKGEVVGQVLRTKANTRPLFISVGHCIALDNARQWVLNCCRGYRLPEPTRLAHLAAGGNLAAKAIS